QGDFWMPIGFLDVSKIRVIAVLEPDGVLCDVGMIHKAGKEIELPEPSRAARRGHVSQGTLSRYPAIRPQEVIKSDSRTIHLRRTDENISNGLDGVRTLACGGQTTNAILGDANVNAIEVGDVPIRRTLVAVAERFVGIKQANNYIGQGGHKGVLAWSNVHGDFLYELLQRPRKSKDIVAVAVRCAGTQVLPVSRARVRPAGKFGSSAVGFLKAQYDTGQR